MIKFKVYFYKCTKCLRPIYLWQKCYPVISNLYPSFIHKKCCVLYIGADVALTKKKKGRNYVKA